MWYEDALELALEDEGIEPSDLAEDDDDILWDYWDSEDNLEEGFNPYEGSYDYDC